MLNNNVAPQQLKARESVQKNTNITELKETTNDIKQSKRRVTRFEKAKKFFKTLENPNHTKNIQTSNEIEEVEKVRKLQKSSSDTCILSKNNNNDEIDKKRKISLSLTSLDKFSSKLQFSENGEKFSEIF